DREEASTQPTASGHALGEIHPDPEEDQRRRNERQDVAEERALDDARVGYVVLRKLLREVGIDARSNETRALVRAWILVRSLDDVFRDRDFLYLARLEILLDLAVRNRLALGRAHGEGAR